MSYKNWSYVPTRQTDANKKKRLKLQSNANPSHPRCSPNLLLLGKVPLSVPKLIEMVFCQDPDLL